MINFLDFGFISARSKFILVDLLELIKF